jgi:hypothetical protein
VIAMEQFTTVINIRQTYWASARERDRTGADGSCGAGVSAGAGILCAGSATVTVVDTIACRDAIPEVEQILIIRRTVPASELSQFVIGQHPDTDAITIRDAIWLAVSVPRHVHCQVRHGLRCQHGTARREVRDGHSDKPNHRHQ